MKNVLLLITVQFVALIFCQAQDYVSPDYGNNKAAGAYKTINGIQMYYETYGHGKPLILLHGNGGSIKGHRGRISYFKNYYKVIAIDSRAHGKSLDTISKTLTYEQMANDTKVLLDSLHIDSAFVWGQSDGGILGLIIAMKYPAKVAKLATFGANIFAGDKAIYKEIDDMVKDTLKVTKNFQTRRLYTLLAYEPNMKPADLQKITAPVLIMAGDRDAIKLEHSQMLFDNIVNSNLFIMPGATHFGAYTKSELFNMVLMDFFSKPFSKPSSIELFAGKKQPSSTVNKKNDK